MLTLVMFFILSAMHVILPFSILSGQFAWDAAATMRISNIRIILLNRKVIAKILSVFVQLYIYVAS